MKPTPKGWPRISSSLCYQDAPAAIDFLTRAFGFEVRLRVDGEGGRIEHSEVTYGEGLIMVASPKSGEPHEWREKAVSPRSIGGKTTQTLCVYVDDVDAHCERAKAAGAEIIAPPKTTDYGEEYWADRSYCARDREGHFWWFMQRVREPKQA